jgi:hypothetical protein
MTTSVFGSCDLIERERERERMSKLSDAEKRGGVIFAS